jgi:alanine racemase
VRPEIHLDAETLRANVRAWRARSGGSVRAVVKSDGYGWGYATLVGALDEAVDGYYVSDADEFASVRALTKRPIATLTGVPLERLPTFLEAGGIPTLSRVAEIEATADWAAVRGKRARIRLALRSAIGWSGVTLEELPKLASVLAARDVAVELSSHITDATLAGEQARDFQSAFACLREAGVGIVGTDLASSAPLATGATFGYEQGYTQVRLGVALFGARFGADVPVASALRVRAPVVEVHRADGQRTGYGLGRAPHDGYLALVRCGYGDGFPRFRDEATGVLAVGMQFTTLHLAQPPEGPVDLIDASTDLDALAARAGTSVHELVVGLGLASRAYKTLDPVQA